MRAFVTGATGLLGSNLVDLLVEQGHEVKALVRSAAKAKEILGDRRIHVVPGNITAVPKFAAELAGSDVVFHCAAYHRECSDPGDHAQALRQVNVEATMTLIESCRRSGVYNVVFVSSNGATGRGKDGPASEESGYDEQTDNPYFKSKIETEKEIDRHLAEHPEMRVVIIRPALMIGPGDSGPTPAGQVILNLLDKKTPVILPGKIAVVDARDVAAAMIAAATLGAAGERFIVGGRGYTMAEFAETLEAVSGIAAPRHRPPYPMAMMMLTLLSLAGRITGGASPVKPGDLRRMRHLQAPDSAKAQRVLKVCFRELSESLRDTAAWFKRSNSA